MSRSRKEEALTKLTARLDALNEQMKQRAKMHPNEAMKIGMFQAAIQKIQRQAKEPNAVPSELWQHAKDHVESYVSRQKKVSDDAELGHMINLFAEPIEPSSAASSKPVSPVSAYDLPSPEEFDISDNALDVKPGAKGYGAGRPSQIMMFHPALDRFSMHREEEVRLAEAKLIQLFNVSELEDLMNVDMSDAELAKRKFNIEEASPEVMLLMLKVFVQKYIQMVEGFLGPIKEKYSKGVYRDNDLAIVDPEHFDVKHDAGRTKVMQALLVQLRAVDIVLKGKLDGKETPEQVQKFVATQVTAASQLGAIIKHAQDGVAAADEARGKKFDPYAKTGWGQFKSAIGFDKTSITNVFVSYRDQSKTINGLTEALKSANELQLRSPSKSPSHSK